MEKPSHASDDEASVTYADVDAGALARVFASTIDTLQGYPRIILSRSPNLAFWSPLGGHIFAALTKIRARAPASTCAWQKRIFFRLAGHSDY
jgi:hypothetical protein